MTQSLRLRSLKSDATYCPAVELDGGQWRLASSGRATLSHVIDLCTAGDAAAAVAPATHVLAPPVAVGRHRRARPGDAALLAALASGPLAAQAVALPWAVGVASAGALADPSRGYRPPPDLGPAALPAVPDGGMPRLLDGDGHGFRVQVSRAAGIPWGAGHWPLLPRLSLGGQAAWYEREQTTESRTVTPPEAAAIARRLASRWWPLLHHLGVDWGPLALPMPPGSMGQPLATLKPGDSATISRGRVYLGSLGLVLCWLRLGPQVTGHTSATLHMTHGVDGHLHVALSQGVTGRQLQLIADLPLMGAAYVGEAHSGQTRSCYRLDMTKARGQLLYLLVGHSWASGVPVASSSPAYEPVPGHGRLSHPALDTFARPPQGLGLGPGGRVRSGSAGCGHGGPPELGPGEPGNRTPAHGRRCLAAHCGLGA